jgi:RIO kinase 1
MKHPIGTSAELMRRTCSCSPRYHGSHLYIIDVSQSVEHDHPSSFDFLRKDIQNVNDYFERRSGGAVRTLGGRGTFDFVVNEVLQDGEGVAVEDETEEGLKDVIRKWLERGVGLASVQSTGGTEDGSADSSKTGVSNAGVDDKVFMSSYIPRSLAEVYDPERDTAKLTSGGGDDLIYSGVTGIGEVTKSKKEDQEPKVLAADGSETAEQSEPRTVRFEDDSDDEEELSTEGEDETGDRKPRGFRHEDREAKKVSHCLSHTFDL